jgi:hypothetical protein
MQELLNKYPLGYEEYLVEKGLGLPSGQEASNISAAEADKETVVEESQGMHGTDLQARA